MSKRTMIAEINRLNKYYIHSTELKKNFSTFIFVDTILNTKNFTVKS